jgi:hypothetical protein
MVVPNKSKTTNLPTSKYVYLTIETSSTYPSMIEEKYMDPSTSVSLIYTQRHFSMDASFPQSLSKPKIVKPSLAIQVFNRPSFMSSIPPEFFNLKPQE